MDGKSDQPEIFETLKSVAGNHRSTKDLIPEVKSAQAPPVPQADAPAAKAAPETQFLCPVCDTPVSPDDAVCPGCGAEFSEGESTEYECPVCKAAVPATADHCPSCGVRFVSEEDAAPEAPAEAEEAPPPRAAAVAGGEPGSPRLGMKTKVAALRNEVRTQHRDLPFGDRKLIARELPRLVNEVKPLLVSAKKMGIGIEEGKQLIANAVEAGKRKEMEKAVRLVSDARRSLDLAFVEFIGGRLETFASEVEAAGSGEAAKLTRPVLDEALEKLSRGDYDGAWESLQTARTVFSTQAKEYVEGRRILESTERLTADVRGLGMDTREIERLTRESRDAAAKRDLAGSMRMARESQEQLLKAAPGFVQGKMREARDALLDMKVHGGDITKPASFLKEASARVKSEEWSEAIRFLKEFNKEMSRAQPAGVR